MKKLFCLILLLLLSRSLFAQIDNTFWFVAPEVSSNHGDRPIFIRVSTMEDSATVTLRMPASPSFSTITQSIPANSTYSFALTSFIDSIEDKPADHVLDRGLQLSSTHLVTAYYEVANESNPEIFPFKGKNALGTEFYISGQTDYRNYPNKGTEAFDIIATEDSTWITITPTLDIVGHEGGVPFRIMLNKGQTYSARTMITTPSASLAGSHVVSNKPIAITISDDSIETGGYDLIGDQTVPEILLGNKYIVIKGYADNTPPSNDDERVYVLATKDNTRIYLNGNTTPLATVNTGQQYDYPIPDTSNTAYFTSSDPVYVYHLSGNPGEAGSSIIPQDSCTGSKQIGFNRTAANFFAMLILTRNGNQDSFYLNGNKNIIKGSDFNIVPGTSNQWVYYRNSMSTSDVPVGTNIIRNTLGKFHLGIINNVGASSEYGYYSDFSSLNLGVDQSICRGDSIELDGGPYMASYEWRKNSAGTWLVIDTLRYLTVHDTGYYACMTNGDFCTLRDTIHISYYPVTSISLGSDQTLCEGASTTLDPGLFSSYLWNTGNTSRTLNVNSAGTYWVRVITGNGCIASDTIRIAVDSLPRSPSVITGPTTLCQGQNGIKYSIDSIRFASTYIWTLPPGATGGSTTDSILLNYTTTASSGVLKVKGHNACGDSPEAALNITVKPMIGATETITGTAEVCQGQTGLTYSIPPVSNALNYTWSIPSGTSVVSGSGSPSITVDYSTGASSGEVMVFASNTCGNSDTARFPVTVDLFPQPAGTISGLSTVCQGQTGLIYSIPPVTGADSYIWTYPPGVTVLSGAGTNTLTVAFDSTTSTSGTFIVLGHSNKCGDGISSSLTVNVNPLPGKAGPISGQNPVCQTQTGVVYSISPVNNATNYIWTLPPGATITSGNGTNSITVDFSSSALSGQITVKGNNALCGNGVSSSISMVVNPFPQPAAVISGEDTVCQGQSGIVYSIPSITGADSYIWAYPAGVTVLSGSGTHSLTVSFDSITSVSGNFTVKGHSNNCGDGVASSLAVKVNPLPVRAGTISGPTSVCQGVSAVYSVPAIQNATNYVWSLPSGVSILSGNGTRTLTVMFTSSAISGTITVYGNNPFCGNGISSSLNVHVNPLPVAASSISGKSPVCQAQNDVIFSINPINYATSYLWTYSGTGVTLTNKGDSASISFSNTSTSGNLFVAGQNACGTGPSSPLFPLTVNPIIPASLNICNSITTHNAQAFTLRGGIPLEGTYSGTGVSGTKFFPAAVPSGTDTVIITYSYSNIYGCQSRAQQVISVLPATAFLCGNNFTDVRDNKSYPTVKIGTQCWMSANLDYGNVIPSSQMASDNCIPEKYCYQDNPALCTLHFTFYQWDEIMQYDATQGVQGICPPGWHIPGEPEWNILFAQYITNGFAGSPLKHTGYSGFNALLEGAYFLNQSWSMNNFAGFYWSSTSHGGSKAWAHGMNSYNPSVSYIPAYKSNAFSVRCIKD